MSSNSFGSRPDAPDRSAGIADATASKLLFALAAGISLAASIYLFFSGQREEGIFVGLWVPSILSAGALLHQGGASHE